MNEMVLTMISLSYAQPKVDNNQQALQACSNVPVALYG
jgi:hypothetical protein